MADPWQIVPRLVTARVYGSGITTNDTEYPPPGLLLSLGDGSAIQATAVMLAKAVMLASGKDQAHVDSVDWDNFELAKWFEAMQSALIQQAQEARDV